MSALNRAVWRFPVEHSLEAAINIHNVNRTFVVCGKDCMFRFVVVSTEKRIGHDFGNISGDSLHLSIFVLRINAQTRTVNGAQLGQISYSS